MWGHSGTVSSESECAICGCDNPNVLQEHHRIPSRFGGTDREENLVVLCANCHAAIERIYNEAFWSRVQSLTFDSGEPDPEKHFTNLLNYDDDSNTSVTPGEKERRREKQDKQLDELAREIVDDGRVSDFQLAGAEVDKDLLKWEFDIDKSDAKILRKLIRRERSAGVQETKPPKQKRDAYIYKLSKQGISQKKIATAFDLTQPTVSKICNEQADVGNGGNSEVER